MFQCMAGCYPLAPNRLAYPEYLPAHHLYNSFRDLKRRLRHLLRAPQQVRCNVWRLNYYVLILDLAVGTMESDPPTKP